MTVIDNMFFNLHIEIQMINYRQLMLKNFENMQHSAFKRMPKDFKCIYWFLIEDAEKDIRDIHRS